MSAALGMNPLATARAARTAGPLRIVRLANFVTPSSGGAAIRRGGAKLPLRTRFNNEGQNGDGWLARVKP